MFPFKLDPRLAEYFDYPLNGSCQHINFFLGVIEGKRRTRCRWNVEPLHYRLRAMMARPNRDSLLVKNRSDIMWMNIIDYK
jgi:hypothetical protein